MLSFDHTLLQLKRMSYLRLNDKIIEILVALNIHKIKELLKYKLNKKYILKS